jgi:alpha-1,3-rhamnosyl/mannosyltransferase
LTLSRFMALRVGFNAAALAAPRPGIGNYILHLEAALAESGDVELFSFSGREWRPGAASVSQGVARSTAVKRLRGIARPLLPLLRKWRRLQQQRAFAHGERRHALDVYHEPNYVPFVARVPTVITIHDLSWVRYPETHPRDRVRWLEREMPAAVERAAAIIVDSDFTRGEVLSAYAVNADRVHRVHLGVARSFHPRGATETTPLLRTLGIEHGGYLLTVGTLEPRKNIGHVLDAYALLPDHLRDRYPLAVAGASGWRAGRLTTRLNALAAGGRVRFLGAVADADLSSLYAGAVAFVFASIYEGFGLPPLEAMASGVPVLVSNRSALPEVVGDAAMMLDPDRPDDTAKRIEGLLDDPDALARMRERGLRRAAAFTWGACAQKTIAVYRAALQGAAS